MPNPKWNTDWEDRWKNWSEYKLRWAITPSAPTRYENYAKIILDRITPSVTLDIGGGTGWLGEFLPGSYTVMDHPRIEEFCRAKFVPIGPIAKVNPKPDLVINTHSWGETSLDIVADYLDQIAEAKIPYLFLDNRKHREVDFDDYPLDRWREVYRLNDRVWVTFLGELVS